MVVVHCPVCKAPARHSENIQNLVHFFECVRCGAFRCEHYAIIALKRVQWSNQQIGTVSGYLRRNSGMFLTSEGVDQLKELPVTTVGEKATRLLLELGTEYPAPGESFWAPVFGVQSAFGKLEQYLGEDVLPSELISDPAIASLR